MQYDYIMVNSNYTCKTSLTRPYEIELIGFSCPVKQQK